MHWEYTMYKVVGTAFVIALVCLIPALAGAHQLELFGFNSRATGLANAYTALAEGPEAAFYNPGALIESKQIRAFGGFSFTVPALNIELQDDGGDSKTAPDVVRDARSLEASQFVNMGVSGGLYDLVFLGLGMQVPVDGKSRRKIFTANRPYFLDYDTGIFGMTMLPAAAVQLASNFGLGAAARITIDPFGTTWTDVPIDGEGAYADTLATSELSAQASPIFGFYVRSHEFLRFGLVYSGQSYSYYNKTVQQKLVPSDPDGIVEVEYEAKYNFIPRRLTLAVAGEPDEHVLLTGELSWNNWAAYEGPFPNIHLNFKRMAEAGLDYERPEILDVEDPDLNNTWTPRFGVEVKPYKFLALRAGYAFESSAADAQKGSTTIIDAPTSIVSFGFGGNFGGPRGDLVSIDLSMMDHIVATRSVNKDEDEMDESDPELNPLYPRYEAGGHFIYSSLTASFKF